MISRTRELKIGDHLRGFGILRSIMEIPHQDNFLLLIETPEGKINTKKARKNSPWVIEEVTLELAAKTLVKAFEANQNLTPHIAQLKNILGI